MSKKDRPQVRINVTEEAKEKVKEMVKTTGMTQEALISRVYMSFTEQPDVLQDFLLKRVSPSVWVETLTKIAAYFDHLAHNPPIPLEIEPWATKGKPSAREAASPKPDEPRARKR